MARKYNHYNILKLLVEGFSERELRFLCRNLEGFQPLYSQLSERATKVEMADQIIEYATQRNNTDTLLNWLKENNPSRYEKHQPYYDDIDSDISTTAEMEKDLQSTPLTFLVESPYGTISTGSPFYIERAADQYCWELISQSSAVTLFIQAPRQMGKSSLMLRIIERATRELAKKVVFIDFQKFPAEYLIDEEKFLIEFCQMISDSLDIPEAINQYWQERGSNIVKCSRYLSNYILPRIENSLILAFDEVERLLTSPFYTNFFGMLRTWHNDRAYDQNMAKMSLFLSSSTEPYLFIDNRNQSPFNVANVISLPDFTLQEVNELNKRHNSPLSPDQLNDLMDLISGHPYLIRRALYLLATERIELDTLFAQATQDTGPFGDHLRHYLYRILQKPELEQALSDILLQQTYEENQTFYRLKGAGLIKKVGNQIVLRNNLYTRYFWERLNLSQAIKLAVGGPVQAKNGIYISRPADEALFNACRTGKFSYVLSARQIGKSSLMFETAQKLSEVGIKTVLVDLNTVGFPSDQNSWYFSLIDEISRRAKLDFDIETWWEQNPLSTPSQRFLQFLRNIMLAKIPEPIVIFIDEIDFILGSESELSNEFFAIIRAIYNDRAQYPAYHRLAFVLLGVATPDELINDKTRTPFNIGQAITLRDFTKEECAPFWVAIETLYPRQGRHYFDQIYEWTAGHPYLVQKLCDVVLKTPNPKSIDELVVKLFLASKERSEDNLSFVQTRVTYDRLAQEMLRIYKQVLLGDEPFPDDELSPAIARLKFYGLVVTQSGYLKVRNKLYAYAFNLDWVDDMLKTFERSPYLTTRFFEKAGLSAWVLNTEQEGQITNILARGQDPRYRNYQDIYVRCVEGMENKIEHFESLRDFVLGRTNKGNKPNPLDGQLAFFISDQRPTLGMLLTLYSYKAENNFTIVPLDKDYVNVAIAKEDTRPDLDNAVDRHIGKVNQYEGSNPIDDPNWFFGHELTMDIAAQYLHKGQHVGIFGLRKIGKTSLIKQLQYKLNNDLTCHIDLQAASRNCHYLYGKIIKRLAQDLRRHSIPLPSLQLLDQDYPDEEQQMSAFRADIDTLGQAMVKQNRDYKIVIFLDEVDLMLPLSTPAMANWWRNLFRQFVLPDDTKEAETNRDGFKGFEQFFATLRGLAQEKGHLVVVATSVNADINRVPRWETGTTRDNPMWQAFIEYFLPLLRIDEANLMIESIGSIMGIKYEITALDEIYRLSGGHPYIARQICSSIVDECPVRQITLSQVHKGIERFLSDRTNYFETLWGDVTDTLYQKDAKTVRNLLVKIATHKDISTHKISDLIHIPHEKTNSIIKSLKEIHILTGNETVKIRMDLFAEWICRVKS